MSNFTSYLHKPIRKVGYTVLSICDIRLSSVYHRIFIGYNTFLQETITSNCNVTTIKKLLKYFRSCASGMFVYCHYMLTPWCEMFTEILGIFISNMLSH